MANTDDNTIALQVSKESAYFEGYCKLANTITPGMLLKRLPVPLGYGVVEPHNSSGGAAENLFAVESAKEGRDIYTDYTQGERVFARICRTGDVILGWTVSAGPVINAGTFLMSNGNGVLTESSSPDEEGIVAISLEDHTTGVTPARTQIQIV